MECINSHSRVAAMLTLNWISDTARHEEQLWADPVSLWRDVIDPALLEPLLGKGVGDRAEVTIPADRFYAPHAPRKRIQVRDDQFLGHDGRGNRVAPQPGRFYPRGFLHGVSGVFMVSTAPCRSLGRDKERLLFDLNHPLAGRDLRLAMEVLAVHPPKNERGGRCEHWLERICDGGPGMQARPAGQGQPVWSAESFRRDDERPDALFYRQPRLVHHLDSTARAEIERRYGALIRPGSRVLDLMSSWTSHLPDSLDLAELTVLGLNDEELRRNARATATLVRDLNLEPALPFAEAHFDTVICTGSVEYLTNPLAVLAEVRRVLRPGGVVAFAFSNRWFPPKAIRIWAEMHEFERLGLVTEFLHATGGFVDLATLSRRGLPRPVDDPHQELWLSDPLYMVWGRRGD